jgi:mevalonate kinase
MPQQPSRSEPSSTKTRLPRLASAKAPGKIILAGEQFVVLGAPAVAMAIDLYSKAEAKPNDSNNIVIGVDIPLKSISKTNVGRRIGNSQGFLLPLRLAAEVTLDHIGETRKGVDVNVACEIPIAAGLGSSASTTVAIISAVARSQGVELTRKEIFKLAFIPEKFLHGKPSGVDQATCIYGGTIEFTRPSSIKPVLFETDPVLLLCDSGIHHETKTLVGSVVKKSQTQKGSFRAYLTQVRDISRGVSKALKTGDSVDLGLLMSLNHELLRKIGVSHPKLDRLVMAAKKAGALGAKLTGAGGGGCIVCVCPSQGSRERIARTLRREGGTPFSISRDSEGVRATSI